MTDEKFLREWTDLDLQHLPEEDRAPWAESIQKVAETSGLPEHAVSPLLFVMRTLCALWYASKDVSENLGRPVVPGPMHDVEQSIRVLEAVTGLTRPSRAETFNAGVEAYEHDVAFALDGRRRFLP